MGNVTNDNYFYDIDSSYTRKKKKNKTFITVLLLLACIGAFAWGFKVFFTVNIKSKSITLELGHEIDRDINTYISGSDFIISNSSLDFENVNYREIGNYKISGKSWIYKYSIDVKVEDTTPPEINNITSSIYIAKDKSYPAESFIKDYYDFSGKCEVYISDDEVNKASIEYKSTGYFTLKVKVVDTSGNEAVSVVPVNVDTPPTIIGAYDRKVKQGQKFDPMQYIIAVDTVDGVVTDGIEVKSSNVNVNKAGKYEVCYRATDSFGLTSEITAQVEVGSSATQFNYTKEDLKKIINAGYFKYEPLDKDDKEAAKKLLEPCLIDLYLERNNGYGYGSGFISDITEDYVYFMSVDHVTSEMKGTYKLMFYNGAYLSFNNELKSIRLESENEAALFRIPTKDIPVDTLIKLKQVYIDTNVYSSMSYNQTIIAYAKNWGKWGEKEDQIKEVKVTNLNGTVNTSDHYYTNALFTTAGIVKGMSGTAAIDFRGRLVGIVSAVGLSDGKENSSIFMKINNVGLFNSRLDELS